MKVIGYVMCFIFLACSQHFKDKDSAIAFDTISENKGTSKSNTVSQVDVSNKIEALSKVNKEKYYTKLDTLFIKTEIGETYKYSKVDFNKIIDHFPALYDDNIQEPDLEYNCSETWKDIVDENGDTEHLTFGSEVGKDEYFVLYAYFLKQKNGVKEHTERRKKLIDIYSNLNSLFGSFEYGGTYFGHQSVRILGYAEYSIYLYIQNREDFYKTYDISKQKDLYIKSLRQLIDDECVIDNNAVGQEKVMRKKELNQFVDRIEKGITDNFNLRRAQEFQYRRYEYY